MSMFLLFLFLFFVWILICLAPVLEKKAKQQSGGVSLFPSLPIMPFLAWGLAWGLNFFQHELGLYLIGGLHLLILALLLLLGIKWQVQIRKTERRAKRGRS